ncbi:hypothetical protein [Anaplasma phagocytophilum]|uniref:hypothetical protein n=1 Tax=Anaplasma phagocytophilum TaxID=948 RepID=UPI00061FC115|nr:hypothetical protein [Anaplasma phagocytophilum]KJV59817.1 hypothetical protein APHWEB_1066 [Anaplasma phagocytophilum str. Webster]KJV87248.1 hypothetical protein APHNYW_0958 [Anaplasma phagocytophilum str. ApNYW]KJV98251.1 hypothetical protein OTSANNIE_1215 [Anaplasma phagocytophilum str. Annie]KJZ99007.1 hypothetical protein APHCR_0432 [Anaplasma phagocytophilum str. CR1007]
MPSCDLDEIIVNIRVIAANTAKVTLMAARIKSHSPGHLSIHPRIKPLTPLPGFDAVPIAS